VANDGFISLSGEMGLEISFSWFAIDFLSNCICMETCWTKGIVE